MQQAKQPVRATAAQKPKSAAKPATIKPPTKVEKTTPSNNPTNQFIQQLSGISGSKQDYVLFIRYKTNLKYLQGIFRNTKDSTNFFLINKTLWSPKAKKS